MNKLHRSNLSGDAYAFVKELFLKGGRYSPGDKISVEELSRELGVSRTPLWGAINRLEAEGIVEIVPRQGVYLIDFDPRKALEIYDAREVLEGMAARLAASKITDQQIAQLASNMEIQRACAETGDVDAYAAAAMEFHRRIVEIAGSKTLERLLDTIYSQMRVMQVQLRYFPTRFPQTCDDHDRLLDIFRRRDTDAAEVEARKHIRMLSEAIRESLKEQESTEGDHRVAL